MSHELFVFGRIICIGGFIVLMGVVVERYLTARHFKRCNG